MIARLRAFFEKLREPLYANAYALVANQVISAGLGLIYWPLASHLYSPETYGASFAVISTLLLISGIAQVGLGAGMNRFVPRAGDGTRRLILTAYGVVVAVSVVLSLAFVALGGTLGLQSTLGSGPLVWLWVVLAAVLWSIFRLQDAVLIGLRQAKWVLIENTLYNLAKIGLLFLCAGWLATGGIVGSYFLPTPLTILLVTSLIFGIYTRAGRLEPAAAGSTPPTVREIVSTTSGDYVGSLVAEAASRLLPVLVVATLGAVATANFANPWLVATMLTLVAGSMTDSFTTEAARDRANIGLYSREIIFHMALMVVPASVVLGLGAPLIIGIWGEQYVSETTTVLLRWLCLASPLIVFNNWYLAYARVLGHIRMILWTQALGAGILLGVSWLLLGRMGITGVGIAWIVSQIVVAVVGASDSRGVLTSATAQSGGVSA